LINKLPKRTKARKRMLKTKRNLMLELKMLSQNY